MMTTATTRRRCVETAFGPACFEGGRLVGLVGEWEDACRWARGDDTVRVSRLSGGLGLSLADDPTRRTYAPIVLHMPSRWDALVWSVRNAPALRRQSRQWSRDFVPTVERRIAELREQLS